MPRYCNKSSNAVCLLLLFVGIGTPVFAQQAPDQDDIALIEQSDFRDTRFQPEKTRFLFAGNEQVHAVIKYNPVTLVLGGLMYAYQGFISPQLSTKCAYSITCSRFSMASIREFGLLKGLALSADRLTRCSYLAAQDISHLHIDKEKQVIFDPPEKYYYQRVD